MNTPLGGGEIHQVCVVYSCCQIAALMVKKRPNEPRIPRQEQEALLSWDEDLFSTIPMGMAILDPEGGIRWANRTLAESMGQDCSALVGQDLSAFIPEEDHQVLRGHLARAVETGDQEECVLRVGRPPGLVREMRLTSKPIRDARNRVKGIQIALAEVGESAAAHLPGNLFPSFAWAVRLREALDHSPCLLYSFDTRSNRYDYVSAHVEALLGYTVEEMMRKDIEASSRDIFPEDLGRISAQTKEAIRKSGKRRQVPVTLEFRWKTKSGDYRWISDSAVFFVDEKGKIERFAGSAWDITDRKRAEEALKESENLFRVLAETVPVAIVMIQGMKIIYSNAMLGRILGYSQEEILAKGLDELIHPDSREFHKEMALAHLRGESIPLRLQSPFVTKDGHTRWMEVFAGLAVWKGNPVGVGALLDITDRKTAEEQGRANERFLQNVFDAIQDGICVLDKNLQILRANNTLATWYPEALPLVGKTCYSAFRGLTKPCPDCPAVLALKKKTPQRAEVSLTFSDRSARTIQVDAFPLFGASGEATGVVKYMRDITARRQSSLESRRETARAEALAQIGRLLARSEADVNQVLGILGQALEVERGFVNLFQDNPRRLERLHRWFAEKVRATVYPPPYEATSSIPWATAKLRHGEDVIIPDCEALPREAAHEKRRMQDLGEKAAAIIPILTSTGRLMGCMGLVTMSQPRAWTEDEVEMLHTVAEMLGHYFSRRKKQMPRNVPHTRGAAPHDRKKGAR
jgi:PAS domain S-box-containing protein